MFSCTLLGQFASNNERGQSLESLWHFELQRCMDSYSPTKIISLVIASSKTATVLWPVMKSIGKVFSIMLWYLVYNIYYVKTDMKQLPLVTKCAHPKLITTTIMETSRAKSTPFDAVRTKFKSIVYCFSTSSWKYPTHTHTHAHTLYLSRLCLRLPVTFLI